MIDVGGRALVCDFGCARMERYSIALANITSTPKGTYTYWAPELVDATDNSSEQSKETDVWAFGMAVYVCLRILLAPLKSNHSH